MGNELSKADLQELKRYQTTFHQLQGDALQQAVERVHALVTAS